MLSKVAKKDNAGVLFGTFAIFGTLGTLFINKLGSYLYDHSWHYWPFLLTMLVWAILGAITLFLGLAGKLKER